MIDHNNLTNDEPNISYNTSKLEAEGFKLKFALNLKNPVFQQVIDECLKQNLTYKIKDGESHQKHIWIKGWKNT